MASATYPALDLRFAPGPGAGAFQDMLYAELDAFEPVAIQEHDTGDGWRVFFRTAAQRDAARAALASEFGNALLDITPQDVDDEDWARRSQASLTSVRVGRIVVAPPWDVPPAGTLREPGTGMRDAGSVGTHSGGTEIGHADPGFRTPDPGSRIPHPASRIPHPGSRIPDPEILIVIDPSMGFGTGHHATTRLCLELLQTIDLRARRVIDVGTGSGVLAITARALGASSVSALDNDPDALRNARENAARNGAAEAIDIVQGDLSSSTLRPADIVLANLTGAVIQRHAAALRRLGKDDGVFILSGFAEDQADEIARALGVPVREIVREGEWAAMRLGPA